MGTERKFKRNALKMQYARFCQAWNNEKRFQGFLLATGDKIPEGQHKLGRKPTFAMWKKARENGQLNRPAPAGEAPKQVSVIDPAWDEVEPVAPLSNN